jgi:hypothetical protein
MDSHLQQTAVKIVLLLVLAFMFLHGIYGANGDRQQQSTFCGKMRVVHFVDVLFQTAGNDASKLNFPVLLEWYTDSYLNYIYMYSYLNGAYFLI